MNVLTHLVLPHICLVATKYLNYRLLSKANFSPNVDTWGSSNAATCNFRHKIHKSIYIYIYIKPNYSDRKKKTSKRTLIGL